VNRPQRQVDSCGEAVRGGDMVTSEMLKGHDDVVSRNS
jgi:hypothetical protein